MLSLVPVIFLAAAVQTAAPAQTPEALALDIAKAAYGSSDHKNAFVESYLKSFTEGLEREPRVAQMFAARPDIRTTAINAARRGAGEQYGAVVRPALERSIADVYRSKFSLAELAELSAYYRTPQAQRVLASFSASNAATEVPAAQADPAVIRFLASPTGQKEKALSGEIAQAMVTGMMQAAPKINEAILPLVQQAVQAAANAKKRPG